MGMLPRVAAGDSISAQGFNDLTDVANSVLNASGAGGITADSSLGGLSIGLAEMISRGLIAPAVEAYNATEESSGSVDATRLNLGDVCCVCACDIIDAAKRSATENMLTFRVKRFDTEQSVVAPYRFAIVAAPMSAGERGKIFLDGMVWAKVKLEEAWTGTEPVFYGASPVDGHKYLHLAQDGLFEVLAVQSGVTDKTQLHWALIRLGSARYPLLYEATEDAADDKIKAKPCKADGDLVDLETTFPTLTE